MIKGLYVSGSGMISSSRALEVCSNNISNLQTAGYKRDELILSPLNQRVVFRLGGATSAQVGSATHGVTDAEIYTHFTQGAPEQTGNPLDLALEGEGFFTLQRPDGTVALSRNGQFSTDAEGYLCDGRGNLLLGANGPIAATGGSLTVNASGQVLLDGTFADTLRITCPFDNAALVRQADGLYGYDMQAQMEPFTGEVRQGFLEASNADALEVMTDMMENARAYQSCARLVRMMDQILDKSVNELGRL